ncbi:hypothetical protein DM02DRAFT_617376 [Periconia macrospinosa]|uniref:DUF7730 domain-containing protein n=1 Tax=Periconia macrospinosa TaxID=97972 RepID=A0A2V1DDL0_9PLEO|nr:hypothetical protein DM02DRAFT_617376 [Periconia macrospinosa]
MQTQSTLFSRIHPELRLMIWKHAIGAQTLHIVSKYRRLGHAVCDEDYWEQARSERPDIRASSYLFVYGSLPTTKQLADWSMCNLLVACRKLYNEAISILYQTNTFALWDLRTITAFKDGIPSRSWETIRSIDVYAMNYREDDNAAAVEVRSELECAHWSQSCSALLSLPNLRSLRVFMGNVSKFNEESTTYQAALSALRPLRGVGADCEVYFPEERPERRRSQWRLCRITEEEKRRLEHQLQQEGFRCRVHSGTQLYSEHRV